ncbi:TonB-dependent receptor [Flavobacterium soyangense]|uniref:TonB-dependent receptor n=1 Tax=Flavobacterium soyangense TaxID=2023265 RepID=A0A930XZ36_9FLAO|nr:TonB-dependent receptor [Flavobacterium soyangense]MBF2707029.1 TonB-dependent receptor [Flavobacterium soyangense]
MKLSFFFFFLFFVSSVFSQSSDVAESTNSYVANATPTSISSNKIDESSIIKGTVIEESTGKPLPGVLISIVGTKLANLTDAEGKFSFRKMPAGKYNLQFSLFSFATKIISEVEVIDKEATILTVSLSELNGVLDEVVVKTVKAKTESVKSLLTMQKNSVRVSDGISAESIKRTPDKTASDVLKRISGASIQNNKFVIIRGLNDRYNTTYLNGAPLPSTEPDRKAFSFDIFPANMIDNLVIYKTASPDLPGEFAGGVVEITTKATPDKNFQTIAIGTGYNTITTGKNQLYSKDIKSALPSYFPDVASFQTLQNTKTETSIQQIASLAKTYQTDWNLDNKKFSPNTSFQYTLGRYFKFIGEESLGLLVSLSHNVTNNYNETNRRTYETPGALKENQLDQTYNEQKLSGAIVNLGLKINVNNSFSFKNLYSVNSESRIMYRNGSLSQESDPFYISSTNRLYINNKIYTGQLAGEHFLPVSKIKINWVSSFSNVSREVPSERRNAYVYTKYDDGSESTPTAFFSINSVGADYPGSIYTQENKEYIISTKVDISKKINFPKGFTTDLKIGGITQSRNRKFAARQLGYNPFNGTISGIQYGDSTFLTSIQTQTNSTIFNAANVGILGPKSSGLTLFDGTKGNDSYTAESNLDAEYLMIDNIFNKFRVVWGARLENYSQKLDSKYDNGDPVKVDVTQFDFLPSVNVIYSLTKKQNLRLSASKTLNRPEFRELAPFLFYDNATKMNTSGDPTLKITDIINADLRYEIFPGKAQLFSISAFYKDFTNPIEVIAKANNSNQYKNALSGTNYGIELEYRTLVSSIFSSENTKILNDLTLFTNLAIIRSKVDISNLVSSDKLEDTPLQGQSPYVFNAGLQYMNKELGWSFSANMNRIGNRIAIHGNQTQNDETYAYWEKSRTVLDFQLAKFFLKDKLEFRFNVQNALAQDLYIYQNNDLSGTKEIKGFNAFVNKVFTGDSQNKNGYNSKEDDIVSKTKFGPTLSLGVYYNF